MAPIPTSRRRHVAVAVLVVASLGVATWSALPPPPEEVRAGETRTGKGSHPKLDWTGRLRGALAGVDRVEVKAVRSHDSVAGLPFALEGKATLAEFVALLELDPVESGDLCGCMGEFAFVFRRGDDEVARLHLKHLERLWWKDGRWPAEGVLTAKARERLPAWLASRGHRVVFDAREKAAPESPR